MYLDYIIDVTFKQKYGDKKLKPTLAGKVWKIC